MKQVEILAPAKINLFLKILNKRKDSYHDLETVFEKVSLFDKVILSDNLKNKDVIIESNVNIPGFAGKNNTIYRAIDLIRKECRISRGVYVYLEKNIPIAAGLGGGSSDAIAALRGLDRLWKLGISDSCLFKISKQIGSDVPLFALDGSFLLGKAKGEKLSRIKGTNSLRLWHILIVPNVKISTAFAYSLFDKYFLEKEEGAKIVNIVNKERKLRLTMPSYSANIITYALFNRDVSLLNYYSYNSFENVILKQFSKLSKLKKEIESITKDFVHMSGSGSALFMTFSNRKEAKYLIGKIEGLAQRCRFFLVSTC